MKKLDSESRRINRANGICKELTRLEKKLASAIKQIRRARRNGR